MSFLKSPLKYPFGASRFLFAVLFISLLLPINETEAGRRVIRKELKRGETIDIQTMYWIVGRTCKWEVKPPVPQIIQAPKLGTVKFWQGKINPWQCPSIKIDANFAKYIAGNKPGKDKFSIRWKTTESNKTLRVWYIIEVK